MNKISGSGQQPGFVPLRAEELHGLLIKADKFLGPKPVFAMSDRAVGEVSTCFDDFQPGVDGYGGSPIAVVFPASCHVAFS